jgi:hypothetical protein
MKLRPGARGPIKVDIQELFYGLLIPNCLALIADTIISPI